jgi:transposase
MHAAGRTDFYTFLRPDDVVAMEAGTQSFRMAREIQTRCGCRVLVLNAGDLALIYRSLKKNDREDALKLARIVLRNPEEELPIVPIPSDEEEACRTLLSFQAFLKQSQTRYKNRLHALFAHAGMPEITRRHLQSAGNRAEVVPRLPAEAQFEGRMLLETLANVDAQLARVDQQLKEKLREHRSYAALLMSMPGVGPIIALGMFAYVGDGSRFSRAAQLSYYVGLVPRLDASGDTEHRGHILRRGCTAIRRTIIQGAWALLTSNYKGPLRTFFERIAARRGRKIAVVALARKMLEIQYTMLRTGEIFRDAPDGMLMRKMQLYGLT